ncbi:hypothetical protein [Caballeronia sp. ATUFL_F1_KS4A]|jgi:hypothetical protein|uniref:hypothetical protein n=1 Tax=Caballeronia sp. ATUFL_F1_KS4A TaxID=2921768 RepID=UPI002027AA99|nr:hypothetical protein [Caballeronia sp. ATUFL_F1_KS4A]
MTDRQHTASSTETADTVEQSKPEVPSTSTSTRTWAWGASYGPYDWMDAHTPCDDLSPWH